MDNLLICSISKKVKPGSIGSSSSSRSQDRLIGPLPAKCWPEDFNAMFIHNIQIKGEERIGLSGWRRRYHYQYHHNYLPPPLPPRLLQMKRWGEESREEEPQKSQSHSHSCRLINNLSIILQKNINKSSTVNICI